MTRRTFPTPPVRKSRPPLTNSATAPRALASRRSRTIGLIAGGLKFFGPISSISSIESMAREHGLFMSVMMVHEALCAQADFDNLCDTFNEQNVDAFIFLTPTDVMFAVRESLSRASSSPPPTAK